MRPAGIPLGLLVAAVMLALVLVHTIAYAVASGLTGGYVAAMTRAGHDGYWTVVVVWVVGLTIAAVFAARSRTRFARRADGADDGVPARLIVRVWITLAAASVAGFVLLENVEGLVIEGAFVGLAPVALLGRLSALGPAALAITAVALAAVAVVLVGRVEYPAVLNRSYADLVAAGVYTADFRQSPWAVEFVAGVVRGLLADREQAGALRILECGCGTGVWLEELAAITEAWPGNVSLFGFDLSLDMVAAACTRLERAGVEAEARQGDILDPDAYRFAGDDRYDLVIAYDLVQQLPADIQRAAIDAMLGHVRPGRTLVIFDHDAKSRYGRGMGAKKWLRRYLGVPLVPRHYIHARYPDLEAMRRRVTATGTHAEIIVKDEKRKRAPVIAAPATTAADGPAAG